MSWRLRPPTEADIPALVELEHARSRAAGIESAMTEQLLRHEWSEPSFDPASQAIVAEADGRIVGRSTFSITRDLARNEGFVHPGHRGLGIGTALVSWFLDAARAKPDVRAMHTGAYTTDEGADALLQRFGFAYERTFLRMLHRDPAAIAEPEWPDGVRLAQPTSDELLDAVIVAHDNSFIDHWNFYPAVREDWKYWLDSDEIDPSLWFVALGKDDEVAGFCLNYLPRTVPRGDLGPIGTTRAYRGIGLGRALLRHSVRELARRGATEVELGVDSINPNGAMQLYASNGFEPTHEYRVYRLER